MAFLLANPVDPNYMLHGRAEVILQGVEIYTFYPKNPTNHCAYQYFRTKVFFLCYHMSDFQSEKL